MQSASGLSPLECVQRPALESQRGLSYGIFVPERVRIRVLGGIFERGKRSAYPFRAGSPTALRQSCTDAARPRAYEKSHVTLVVIFGTLW